MVSEKKKQELMERIIDLSESVEEREVDPFEVDVPEFLERLDDVFRDVEDSDDLILDIQAILGLTDVISQQEDWIKHKSSLLHFDPMMVTWKVRGLEKKELAEVLVNSWHPTVALESVSKPGLKEALDYWENLAPIDERGAELGTEEVNPEEISRDELEEFGFESKEDFDEVIEQTWEEIKEMADEDGQIAYWDFVDSQSFRETVRNAWLVSFLISYGYASLEIDPLEEDIALKVREERETPTEETGTSVPIAISKESWEERREQDA